MVTSTETQNWLPIGEAARRLDIHVTTLRRWADKGQIPHRVTVGGHRRFSADVIAGLLAEQQELRSGDIGQNWAAVALTETRRTLAEHEGERWLGTNGGWREQHRVLGRQLMGLTMQFVAAGDEDAEQILSEARKFGRNYARIGHEARLSLVDSLAASIFFRDMLIEAVFHMPELIRIRPESTVDLLRKVNTLLNTVHLTIAEEYDAFNDDI